MTLIHALRPFSILSFPTSEQKSCPSGVPHGLCPQRDNVVLSMTLSPAGGLLGPGRAEFTVLTLTPAPRILPPPTAASTGGLERTSPAADSQTSTRWQGQKPPVLSQYAEAKEAHLGNVFLLIDPSQNTANRFQKSKNCNRIDWSAEGKARGVRLTHRRWTPPDAAQGSADSCERVWLMR